VLRRMTGAVADVHFAPTHGAREHLLQEGIDGGSIHVTGNTVVDAVERMAALPHVPANPELVRLAAAAGELVLVTAHRRESFGEPLREVFGALREIADRCAGVTLLYPVHPNPNVRRPAEELLGGHPRIVLTTPLDYMDLLFAMKRARLVITDSGGIQEEAPSLRRRVLVLREVTERPEGIASGHVELVGTDRERIVTSALRDLQRPPPEGAGNPYGDGRAGERIADIAIARLTGRPRQTEDWAG
jgi:UDP-N-acetylglucosamine 2-epimerase (non-hydrolysing)